MACQVARSRLLQSNPHALFGLDQGTESSLALAFKSRKSPVGDLVCAGGNLNWWGAGMKMTLKVIHLARKLDTEKQRRTKAERQARVLRIAITKWHRQTEPPAARKVWHP
jgi:hypothetical protein